MIELQNLTADGDQRHTILFEESEVIFRLRFLSTMQQWFFTASYKEFIIHNVKLATGVLHMLSRNQPFDFLVTDESGSGLDPFQLHDWTDNRCRIFMFETADMVLIRRAQVPV